MNDLRTETDRNLIDAAFAMLGRSYSPYSHFTVGAALLTKSGKIYTGCNVENAAFSPSICAERTAVVKAVSEGETEFEAIAVVGGPNGRPAGWCTPCGVCRQVLSEFVDGASFRVIMARSRDDYIVRSLDELLPGAFGADSMG